MSGVSVGRGLLAGFTSVVVAGATLIGVSPAAAHAPAGDTANLGGTSDIVWHNRTTHETQIWFMDGNQIARRATVVDENGQPIFIGYRPWVIEGSGDLDGDGVSDIVWHNSTTHETQIWFMDGNQIVRRATVLGESGQPIFVGGLWQIDNIGDLDGDGMSDIVWRNYSDAFDGTGEIQVWFMSEQRIARRATVVREDGQPIFLGYYPWGNDGAGDLDGNGTADIVWHHKLTNETQVWFMSENEIARRANVVQEDGRPILIGLPWRISGAGDLDGNGMSDIVWHHALTNEMQVWFMSGNQIVRRATVLQEDGQPIFVGHPDWRVAGIGNFG